MKAPQTSSGRQWLAGAGLLLALGITIAAVVAFRGIPFEPHSLIHGDTSAVERSIRNRLKPLSTFLRIRAVEQFLEDRLFREKKSPTRPPTDESSHRALERRTTPTPELQKE